MWLLLCVQCGTEQWLPMGWHSGVNLGLHGCAV